jgi:radical SAM protein with 4Fe4S-binding SPASM domain
MIRRCKSAGARVLVTTNGTLLNERRAMELIESGLDVLVISLDAASEAVYSQIRRLANFKKVMENVESFLLLKRRTGTGPYTQVQMVSLNRNCDETAAFIRRWKGKADSVRIKHFYNTADIGHSINQPVRTRAHAGPCVLLWREPVVLCDGTVLPCCVDMVGEKPLGNVREQTLAEIWNNPGFVEMRQKHIEGRHSEIDLCRKCHVFEFPWPFVAGSLFFSDMKLRKVGTVLENVQVKRNLRIPGYS